MQNFHTQHLSSQDALGAYKQILEDVLDIHLYGADDEKVKNAIGLYINYVANRRGVDCEYSFEPLSDKTRKDGEKLVDCLKGGVRIGNANLDENKLRFNDLLLTADNFEDFAFVVQAIEHEFQHLWFNQNPDMFYSFDNPTGIKMEFHSHKTALFLITNQAKKLLESGLTSEADITMLEKFTKALYHFDDNEKYARIVAVESARLFLKDMQKNAGKLAGKQIANEIKEIGKKYFIEEQEKSEQQWQIIKELKPDMHKFLYRMFKLGKQHDDLLLVRAIAETQDIAQLYNPRIFKEIEKFAKSSNDLETLLHLDNSKHAKPNKKLAKKHFQEYIKTHTEETTLLSNYSTDTKNQWASELAKKNSIIIAQEIEETKPKRRVFGRRFGSEMPNLSQETLQSLADDVHKTQRISSDAEGFLRRRENRLENARKTSEQENDFNHQ